MDLPNLHTNILMIQLKDTKWTSSDFSKRLIEVTEDEIKGGIVDSEGKGIVVKTSARDWSFNRLVFHHHITESDVDEAIKKITFVIREMETK